MSTVPSDTQQGSLTSRFEALLQKHKKASRCQRPTLSNIAQEHFCSSHPESHVKPNPASAHYVRHIMLHLVTGSLHKNRYVSIPGFIFHNSQKKEDSSNILKEKSAPQSLLSKSACTLESKTIAFHENCTIYHLNLEHFAALNLKMLLRLFLSFSILTGDDSARSRTQELRSCLCS